MGAPDWLKLEKGTIKFEIPPTRSITYDELPGAVEAAFKHFSSERAGVIKVTGRGPIWLYSAVVHAVAHLAKAVAVYDAVNGNYVVVASHSPEYRVGQVLE